MNEIPESTKEEVSAPRETMSESSGQHWGQMASKTQEISKVLDYMAMLAVQLRDTDSRELEKLINSTYETYKDTNYRYWNLIHSVITLKDHCDMLAPQSDSAKQLQQMLQQTLAQHDVVPLDLERGGQYPEDKCSVQTRVLANDLPPDTVDSVISVPYITRDGRPIRHGEIIATQREEPSTETVIAGPVKEAGDSSTDDSTQVKREEEKATDDSESHKVEGECYSATEKQEPSKETAIAAPVKEVGDSSTDDSTKLNKKKIRLLTIAKAIKKKVSAFTAAETQEISPEAVISGPVEEVGDSSSEYSTKVKREEEKAVNDSEKHMNGSEHEHI